MKLKETAIGKRIKPQGHIDYTFVAIVLALLTYGLIMVFSASSATAHYRMNDTFHFIKKQFFFALFGLAAMYGASLVPYNFYRKIALPFLGASFLLLIVVLTPLGISVNGAQRWLGFGGFQFQPSEVAKLALVIFLAKSLPENRDLLQKFWSGFFVYLVIIGLIAGIILLEPHMSGAMIVCLVGAIMMFISGAKVRHFLYMLAPALAGVFGLILIEPYRMKRFTTFLDPFSDMLGDGFQIVQSLYAIGSGGLFGLGLGQSRQKFLYLPEPQNDFIFSIICEELGFIGALLVVVLFVALIWKGIQIAIKAPDTFSSMLVTGITSLIAVQVILNIAVVTSSMPATGIPLPFFSYGGTSLMILLAEMGIVLNVTRHIKNK